MAKKNLKTEILRTNSDDSWSFKLRALILQKDCPYPNSFVCVYMFELFCLLTFLFKVCLFMACTTFELFCWLIFKYQHVSAISDCCLLSVDISLVWLDCLAFAIETLYRSLSKGIRCRSLQQFGKSFASLMPSKNLRHPLKFIINKLHSANILLRSFWYKYLNLVDN